MRLISVTGLWCLFLNHPHRLIIVRNCGLIVYDSILFSAVIVTFCRLGSLLRTCGISIWLILCETVSCSRDHLGLIYILILNIPCLLSVLSTCRNLGYDPSLLIPKLLGLWLGIHPFWWTRILISEIQSHICVCVIFHNRHDSLNDISICISPSSADKWCLLALIICICYLYISGYTVSVLCLLHLASWYAHSGDIVLVLYLCLHLLRSDRHASCLLRRKADPECITAVRLKCPVYNELSAVPWVCLFQNPISIDSGVYCIISAVHRKSVLSGLRWDKFILDALSVIAYIRCCLLTRCYFSITCHIRIVICKCYLIIFLSRIECYNIASLFQRESISTAICIWKAAIILNGIYTLKLKALSLKGYHSIWRNIKSVQLYIPSVLNTWKHRRLTWYQVLQIIHIQIHDVKWCSLNFTIVSHSPYGRYYLIWSGLFCYRVDA